MNLNKDLYPSQKKPKTLKLADLTPNYKLLEDNIGENLDVLGYAGDFLDTPKAKIQEIMYKLDIIKIKNCF
jgi:hypothetical protein